MKLAQYILVAALAAETGQRLVGQPNRFAQPCQAPPAAAVDPQAMQQWIARLPDAAKGAAPQWPAWIEIYLTMAALVDQPYVPGMAWGIEITIDLADPGSYVLWVTASATADRAQMAAAVTRAQEKCRTILRPLRWNAQMRVEYRSADGPIIESRAPAPPAGNGAAPPLA